ncbi:ABC transporter permease [Hansschlegelia sp. KR7-227]|uniref:ABC transporter permease n=1 Tax=Hansschlegelia sp. KR7-227 TaxID=3400914 RepID=UPI003C08BFE8
MTAAQASAGSPRRTPPRHLGWIVAAGGVALLPAAPVLSLVATALGGSFAQWPHLIAHVLPDAALQTATLLFGVGLFVSVVGCGTAWLVTAYDFPGRRALEWALLLPLAIPTYVVAYAYLDLLHPVGPAQSAIRALLGYSSPRDFRLPDLRSMTGCVLLLGLVLYPYVYLSVRAVFLTQSAGLIEAARTLGMSRRSAFWRVALPLARPGVALGVSLALMEALNDIGASEFLGVRTLTVSIYTTWVTRSDLGSAAQIALVMLALVTALIALERWARRRQRFATAGHGARRMTPRRLPPLQAALALCFCLLPVLFGFFAPAAHVAVQAAKRVSFAGLSDEIPREILNTVLVSSAATVMVVALGALAAFAARLAPRSGTPAFARIAALGYAMPGTVVVIGLLGPVGALDGLIAAAAQAGFGAQAGVALISTGTALVAAYTIRFLAIGVGGAESGLARIPPSVDGAARTLGQTAAGAYLKVHLPLSKSALAAAALLVFVDCLKELPATLLIRPLNFETLATHLYGEAARGTYEDGAVAALIIVAVGLLPVILLSRVGRARDTPARARPRPMRAAPLGDLEIGPAR